MKLIRNILVIGLLSLSLGLFALTPRAQAASFDAGRIIDDAIFNNKSAMSVGDIQNFLNSKVPTCDTWHTAGPSAQGATPPWTCLKNYYENTSTGANNLNGASIPSGAISAAQIIYDAAQTYSINPQVLIVTLQKENGLITDTWPYPWQYRTAMGFACPDNGSCDPAYFGFYKQVNQAARHFRNFYDQNPSWYIPYRPGVNYVQYNPNASCGGSNVNIQNRATASLYSYTPYQPNAAALNNLYNTGDSCSAYGNRNFWRDFTNWFGSTLGEINETNISWNFESLDGSIGSVAAQDRATGQNPRAIQFGTSIQVFYYDNSSGDLKRAYENGSGWVFETLDGSGGLGGRINANVGKFPSASVYNNQLHVFYYDETNGDLRHGSSDAAGNNWVFETLDGDSQINSKTTDRVGINSTTINYGNTLQVFHYDVTQGNLRHTWYTPGNGWANENLDGDPGSIARANANLGEDPEVALYNGEIQLYYYDLTNGNLRHAWTTPKGWLFENLDGDPGSVGRSNSNLGRNPALAVHNGHLQLYYYDLTNGNLRHAWTTPKGWAFENLDGDLGSIFRRDKNTGITPKVLSYNNILYLYYYDQTDGEIRYAYADSNGWHRASLDGGLGSISGRDSNTGIDPTAIIFNGYVQLFYYDFSSNDLRHAWGLAP